MNLYSRLKRKNEDCEQEIAKDVWVIFGTGMCLIIITHVKNAVVGNVWTNVKGNIERNLENKEITTKKLKHVWNKL